MATHNMKYKVVEVETTAWSGTSERVVASFNERKQYIEYIEQRGLLYTNAIVSKHPDRYEVSASVGEYHAKNKETGTQFSIVMKL